MNDIIEIIQKFKIIQLRDEFVKLINVFKGVPVTFSTKVVSVSEDSILVDINTYQATCMQIARHTYIRNNKLPQVVKAGVYRLDTIKNHVILNDFTYAGTTIGDREQVRVEPEQPVFVTIFNGIQATCMLLNISVRGVGMLMDIQSYAPDAFAVNQRIEITFNLPGGKGHTVHIPGVIRSVLLLDIKEKVRLGVRTYPDTNSELILSRYVAHRQAVILREIKSLK